MTKAGSFAFTVVNRTASRVFAAVLICFIFIFSAPWSVRAANCCRCKLPDVLGGEICIKDNLDCGKISASGNKDLEKAACEVIAPDKIAQCAKVASGGSCLNDPGDALSYRTASLPQSSGSSKQTQPNTGAPVSVLPFKMNVDIPGLGSFNEPVAKNGVITVPFLAQYINAMVKFLIGVGLVAAAVMIVWSGFKYILAAAGAEVQAARKTLIDALIGMVILIGSTVILANVNPATMNLTAINIRAIPAVPYEVVSASQYSAAAGASGIANLGGTVPTPTEIFDYANTKAKEAGVDPCIVYAIMMAESRGQVIIGHDENQYFGPGASLVQARLDFIRGRKFSSGKDFDPAVPLMPPALPRGQNACAGAARATCQTAAAYPMDPKNIANEQFKNDDAVDVAKPPDFGLDWRFSHGIGASQGTIFPDKPRCPDGSRGYAIGGKCFSVPELITKEGAVASILAHPNVKPGADPESAFCGYGGRSKADCGPIADLVKHKMDFYAQCPYK